MTAAEKPRTGRDDPPPLRTALALLAKGLRPIPLHQIGDEIRQRDGSVKIATGKEPIGKGWGRRKHDEATLHGEFARRPRAGVGLLLGKAGGVVDFEVDDLSAGEATLEALFGGEILETVGWDSDRGRHLICRWTPRLARYKAIVKGDWLPGVELRFGNAADEGQQMQSVCPPTCTAGGQPRRWNGCSEIAEIPQAVFDYLDRNMPKGGNKPVKPVILKFTGPKPPGSWDAEPVMDACRPHIRALATEWGVQFTGASFDGEWAECRAIDRDDRNPSAGLNLETGVYHDFGSDSPALSFFSLAIALGAFPDFSTAVNSLGQRLGVPQASPTVTIGKKGFGANVRFVPVYSVDDEWELPVLDEDILAEPFPLEVLPSGLAELCRVGAEAMQCPADYLGAAALVLAGASIGLSVNLSIDTSWVESPNLYLAIVGPPGTKKTPAIRLLARTLYDIDRKLREDYGLDLAVYQEDMREYEASKRKGGGLRPPVAPVLSQLTLDDVTAEAIAAVLSENPRGSAIIQDELTGWVASLNAYRAGKGADKQFFLKCNSGVLVKVNRKGSKEPIVVPRPCLSIVGGLTPDTLPSMRENRSNDGWLDRILFAYPKPSDEVLPWRRPRVPEDLVAEWKLAVTRLWDRKMVLDEGRLRPYFVHLTQDAEETFTAWVDAHRGEAKDPNFNRKALAGPWSKMEGFALRMALILSQLHQAYDPDEPWSFDKVKSSWTNARKPRDVSALDIWGAGKLATYFKAHFRRARAELVGRPDDSTGEGEMALGWITQEHVESFSGRDVIRRFRRFTDRDRASAIDWLLARRYIRQRVADPQPTGRPHTPIYDVNPNLYPGTNGTKAPKPPEEGDEPEL